MTDRPVAQLAELSAHNGHGVGSNPAGLTNWWLAYVGMEVAYPARASGTRRLSDAHCNRLAELSERSMRRAIARHGAATEFVDMIAVCIRQQFRCSICYQPLHVSDFSSPVRISVDHDPPLSVAREHSYRTVHAAHWSCNNLKSVADQNKPHAMLTPAELARLKKLEALMALRPPSSMEEHQASTLSVEGSSPSAVATSRTEDAC